MSELPARLHGADPIVVRTQRLMHDAQVAAALHDGGLLDFARQIIAGRRQRSRFFDPMLFANPAWDVMLMLFVAREEARVLHPAELLACSQVPQGVTLRWLRYLCGEGMVTQQEGGPDGSSGALRLADSAAAAVTAYLASLLTLGLGPEPVPSDIPRAAG